MNVLRVVGVNEDRVKGRGMTGSVVVVVVVVDVSVVNEGIVLLLVDV